MNKYYTKKMNQTITNTKTLEIKDKLYEAIQVLGNFEKCALLDYPNNINIGDHLIWLGNIFYLTQVLKTKVSYCATVDNFSEETLEIKTEKYPIFIQGGGNFGDIWSIHENFREDIIAKYTDRPIVVLPQTIYFSKQHNLEKAARVYNSHPNLTLFTRDDYSYDIAIKNFDNCRIIKAPDIAFHLASMPSLFFKRPAKQSILYNIRQDKELNKNFDFNFQKNENLVVEDWISYHNKWKIGNPKSPLAKITAGVFREGWQRGLMTPAEWLSRQQWKKINKNYYQEITAIDSSSWHKKSLSFMHSGIYQLNQYRLVITNRLHGHILCILLGIPHVFLPNSYYKNEAFYEAWTYEINFCRFVKDASKIKDAVEELRELYL